MARTNPLGLFNSIIDDFYVNVYEKKPYYTYSSPVGALYHYGCPCRNRDDAKYIAGNLKPLYRLHVKRKTLRV